MKIHKLNLENYYRNVIDSAIAVLSHLPEAVFAGRPTFNNALLRFNDGEAPVLMLPKWSDVTIDLSKHKPAWAPASLTGTIKVSITPSVVGVEASADETSLGSFDVYGVTGTSTGKQYEVTEGKYAIEYAVSILDGENNPVVVFSNGQALKVVMEKVADNGPDTTLDIGGGGGSFTQEQADWNQSDDTKVDYIKNKPTIPAAQVNADWNAESGVAQILNKPTIPTVNNATLTLTQGTTTLGTFTANASTDVTVDIPAGGDGASIIEKTWSELKAMRDGGTLVPGQQYRITDYVATFALNYATSANKPFDIIVTADSASTLNEVARAILHSGDTYFANCKLEAWKLWYCIDNDTQRFEWADSTNGKGVIYRMIDEWDNDAPYDFKGIKPDGYWTFPYNTNDGSLNGGCHNNKLGEYRAEGSEYYKRKFPRIRFGNISFNNTLGENCHNITLTGDDCQNNTFGNNCNVIQCTKTGFQNNSFGNNCYAITINGTNFKSNSFGNSCMNITFGNNNCTANHFGNSCQAITITGIVMNLIFEAFVWALNLSVTTTIGTFYKNAKFCSGVSGTSSSKLTISDSNVNQAYQTIFFNETDGTLKKQEGSTVTTYTPPA